jgi:spermidine synthase
MWVLLCCGAELSRKTPWQRRENSVSLRAMALATSADYHRRLILGYFGPTARIRILREAAVFDSPIFVVDFDQGARHYRTLGSVGGFAGSGQVTEQSSMDLLYPAHLVFHYERLMSLAYALVERPAAALLLGVGGAAMWRFMRAYLPECAPTLVDCDETVVAIAKRWFYLTQPVVIDTAERYLAATTEKFDVILVDLYNSGGPAAFNAMFWTRCLEALAPGGCLATNWADFAINRAVKPMAENQAELARARGLDCFYVTRRGFRDNLIQYVPTAENRRLETLTYIHERFAKERRLPNGGRGILEQCVVTPNFPIEFD